MATLRDLRDRALIGTPTYSFARITAALKMKVEDLRPRGAGWTIRPRLTKAQVLVELSQGFARCQMFETICPTGGLKSLMAVIGPQLRAVWASKGSSLTR
jgi:hypothetical protein